MSASSTHPNRLVWAILVAYAVYGLIFIWLSSDVIDGTRYFSLHEDAMISMRYAKNLAAGEGFRWNPGESPIEGVTNPLWTGVMAVVHLAAPAPSHASAWVQIIGLFCNLASAALAARIARLVSGGADTAAVLAALLTAFSLPLTEWSLLGMEVGPLAALGALCVWRALRGGGERAWIATYLLLGVGTLFRMDFVVLGVAVIGSCAYLDRDRRWRHVAYGGAMLALFLAAQTAARWAYFGDLLPNTYYLKMSGYPVSLRVSRGLVVFVEWCWRNNLFLLAVPIGLVVLQRTRAALIPAAALAGQCAYSVWVGGDAWEWWGGANRYVSIALPELFALFASGAVALTLAAARAFGIPTRTAITAIGLTALVLFNAINGPRSVGEWLLVHRPVFSMINTKKIEVARAIEDTTTPDALIGVAWGGSVAYFADRRMFDMLGKSERRIGRGPMHLPPPSLGVERLWFFNPGHLKWDYAYAIDEVAPDVVATLWHDEDALPHLARRYESIDVRGIDVFFRKDSKHVRWDRVAARQTLRPHVR